jgi:hypothetical protein
LVAAEQGKAIHSISDLNACRLDDDHSASSYFAVKPFPFEVQRAGLFSADEHRNARAKHMHAFAAAFCSHGQRSQIGTSNEDSNQRNASTQKNS